MPLGLRAGVSGMQIDTLMLQGSPRVFDEDVVGQRAGPSIDIPGPLRFSRSGKVKEVN
ncbi:hypothetical protein CHELA1G2_30065 [Hyphomicrobiales bacterium]|nr:hypothetical protein CHELA1G2_30065 [Hyphomicrobiales bacterium]